MRRGRPLNEISRAEFESMEERVEARLLDEHIDEREED